MSRDRRAQRSKARLHRLARRVDHRVRLAVERLAAGEDAAQIRHRLFVLGHRPCVALRQDPAHMLGRRCLEQYGEAGGEQQIERAGLGDEAAPGGDDAILVALDRRLEAASLEAAKGGLAVKVEDLAERQAGFALDLAVELDEWHAAALGEAAAER